MILSYLKNSRRANIQDERPPVIPTEERHQHLLRLAESVKSWDEEYFKQIDYNSAKFGMQLRKLVNLTDSLKNQPSLTTDKIEIRYKQYPDYLEKCLFCNSVFVNPSQHTIINRISNESFKIPELTLHFIEKHGFCGIPGTEYRIDPREVHYILGSSMFSDTPESV